MYLLQVVFQNYVFIHRKVYQCLVWLWRCILPIFRKICKTRFTLQNKFKILKRKSLFWKFSFKSNMPPNPLDWKINIHRGNQHHTGLDLIYFLMTTEPYSKRAQHALRRVLSVWRSECSATRRLACRATRHDRRHNHGIAHRIVLSPHYFTPAPAQHHGNVENQKVKCSSNE